MTFFPIKQTKDVWLWANCFLLEIKTEPGALQVGAKASQRQQEQDSVQASQIRLENNCLSYAHLPGCRVRPSPNVLEREGFSLLILFKLPDFDWVIMYNVIRDMMSCSYGFWGCEWGLLGHQLIIYIIVKFDYCWNKNFRLFLPFGKILKIIFLILVKFCHV